uniref:Uncharacterized protein n=1 Tax=Arundo donax TaxID=35708 RepID=A0A0A9F035_ARUDO
MFPRETPVSALSSSYRVCNRLCRNRRCTKQYQHWNCI